MKQVYVLPERYSSKGEIPWKRGKSLWKGFCLPLQIFRPVPNLEPVSRNSRNSWILWGDNISPFVSPMGPRLKLWNLAVILPFLISESYQKSSFSWQADNSFKNFFSGPVSYDPRQEAISPVWHCSTSWLAQINGLLWWKNSRLSTPRPAKEDTKDATLKGEIIPKES